jgi:hypothetical protein
MIQFLKNSVWEKKEPEKPGNEKETGTGENEAEPSCRDFSSGVKQSCRSKWSAEFARRFGPG